MKKITRKARNAMIFFMGVMCALLGPAVGWALSGLCPGRFELFLRHYPEKVIVWCVIGFVVGIAVGALLTTLDVINQREKEEEEKANR